jgi:pantetheine-phosphate adenylyltransferase
MSSPVNRALLIATTNDLSTPHPISSVVSAAATSARDHLIVILFSPLFNHGGGISHSERWDDVQKLLSFLYVHATVVAQDMGKVRMQVDLLLRGLDEDVPENLGVGMDVCFRVQGGERSFILFLKELCLSVYEQTPLLPLSFPPP